VETRLTSDVAHLPRSWGYFLEKHFFESEKSPCQPLTNRLSLVKKAAIDFEGKAMEALPGSGRLFS
jgi:hypothetical protein